MKPSPSRGMGTFELVKRNPKLFAAAFPICGGASPRAIRKYKRPSWWVFHGNADPVVPADFSTQMVKRFKKRGFEVRYDVIIEIGQGSQARVEQLEEIEEAAWVALLRSSQRHPDLL